MSWSRTRLEARPGELAASMALRWLGPVKAGETPPMPSPVKPHVPSPFDSVLR